MMESAFSAFIRVQFCFLILSLASCGSAKETSSDSQGNPIIITFATAESKRGIFEPLMKAFHEQNPSIVIQFVALKEADSDLPALASAADTMLLWPGIIASGASGNFRDLSPLIETDPNFQEDDFWPGLLSACQDGEGRIYGIPLSVNLTGVFFDWEVFAQAGLPHPAPGWTWDNFQESVAKLASRSANSARYGFVDYTALRSSIIAPLVEAHLAQNQGNIVAQSLAGDLGWYFDLAGKDALYPLRKIVDPWSDLEILFQEDRPAFWVGQLNSAHPDGSGNAIDKDGFAPFPVAVDGSQLNTTPVDVTCSGMSAGTAHPQEAWAWLEFLTRPGISLASRHPLVDLPARRSLAEEVDYWHSLPEDVESSVRFILEHAWYGSHFPEAFEAIQEALLNALTNDISPVVALEMISVGPEISSGQSKGELVNVPTPPPTPAGETTVVQYYGMGGNYSQALQVLAEEFQATHPGIVVRISEDLDDISPTPGQDPFTRAGEQNDCFIFDMLSISKGIDEQVISLNPLLAAEPPEFVMDFYPSLMDAGRLEGELFSLPVISQPYVMVYNAELLAHRGVPTPSQGWTFDDFIDLAAAVASPSGVDPIYGAVYNDYAAEDLFLAGRAVSGLDLIRDPSEVNFDTPEMASALTWLADLAHSGVLLVETGDVGEAVPMVVKTGQVAFWVGQAGNWGYWWPFEKPSFEIGIAPLPSTPGVNELLSKTSIYGQFISRRAEDPRACWEWMKFLSEQPNLIKGIPARRSVAGSSEYEEVSGKEEAEVLRRTLEAAAYEQIEEKFISTGWPLSYWRRAAIAAALQGNNPQLALTAAQGKAEAYLMCIMSIDIEKYDFLELGELVVECARKADPEWDQLFVR